jgi:hypothetical protein
LAGLGQRGSGAGPQRVASRRFRRVFARQLRGCKPSRFRISAAFCRIARRDRRLAASLVLRVASCAHGAVRFREFARSPALLSHAGALLRIARASCFPRFAHFDLRSRALPHIAARRVMRVYAGRSQKNGPQQVSPKTNGPSDGATSLWRLRFFKNRLKIFELIIGARATVLT